MGSESGICVVAAVADDYMEGLHELAGNRGFLLVRSEETIADAVEKCELNTPCVLLCDERLTQALDAEDGIVAKLRAISLLRTESPPVAKRLVIRGFSGLISRAAPGRELSAAIEAVSRGELWVSGLVLSEIVRELRVRENDKFTRRETELLRLVAVGHSNREIADHLAICRETVRWHLRRLYSKTGASSRAELVGQMNGDDATLSR